MYVLHRQLEIIDHLQCQLIEITLLIFRFILLLLLCQTLLNLSERIIHHYVQLLLNQPTIRKVPILIMIHIDDTFGSFGAITIRISSMSTSTGAEDNLFQGTFMTNLPIEE